MASLKHTILVLTSILISCRTPPHNSTQNKKRVSSYKNQSTDKNIISSSLNQSSPSTEESLTAKYPSCPVGWEEERKYQLIEYEQHRELAISPSNWDNKTVLIEFKRAVEPSLCEGWRGDGSVNCSFSYTPYPSQDTFIHNKTQYTLSFEVKFNTKKSTKNDMLYECVYMRNTDSKNTLWEYVRVLGRIEANQDNSRNTKIVIHVL